MFLNKKIRYPVCIGMLILCLSIYASAMYVPYATYTYSNTGEARLSPHAYVPNRSLGSALRLSDPSRIVKDNADRLYIADSGNNRIVILNPDLTLYHTIETFQNPAMGKMDSLNTPRGVFAAENGTIYVSDTENQRILCFSAEFKLEGIVSKPESELLSEDYDFKPQALVVDRMGRVYVCAENMNMGVMVLDQKGNLKRFLGAQKVAMNIVELFWRRFMTEEQLSRKSAFVPTEYNSIALDAEGFLFVTSSAIDKTLQYAATLSKSKDSRYAPVKRFGAAELDVLYRNGEYPPSGDISVKLEGTGPSSIVGCAPGAYDTYTLVDAARNKLFTYDYDGNLLYAFGGTGSQTGLFQGLCGAVSLSDNRIIALDKTNGTVTEFIQTQYGAQLFEVMQLHNERKYGEESVVWEQIMLMNNNLDYAYIGLGKSLIKSGDYKEAMSLFRAGQSPEYYSAAYKEYRREVFSKWMLVIPIVIVLLVAAVIYFFSFIKKYNEKRGGKPGKKSLVEKIAYGFHVIFHPFDGFWDLGGENRGSIGSAALICMATGLVLALKPVGSGYLFSSGGDWWSGTLTLFLLVGLFSIANWSVTSLADGKGTAAQIFMTVSYSLIPILLLTLPQIALSHFLLLNESAYMSILSNVSYLWTGFLLFAGTLSIHQYTLPKGILVTLVTLLGMVIIVFLSLMFFNLFEPMITFFINYYKEVFYRF